jgi:glucokinase
VSGEGGALRLVADIGGTNARFALAGEGGALAGVETLHVSDFPTFDAALAAWLAGIDADKRGRVASAAFAAAGPVDGDAIKLTNAPWRLAARDISALLGGIPTGVFNDLEAVAYALPFLESTDVAAIGPQTTAAADQRARMVAVNVGTGFGAATAMPAGGGWLACPSEAGHMSLAPANEEEAALLAALAPGRTATLEDVLSGAGVSVLHAAISGGAAVEAGEVFARAGADPAARRAVTLLSRWLGRAAGDLVLATAAWGGAYLLGGVVSGWHPLCEQAAFRAAFEDKGKMRARMAAVFSGVVTREDVALLGLAKAPIGGGNA